MRYVKIRSEWLGHSDCETCPVRADALFGEVPPERMAPWRNQLDELAFPRNSVIFHQGARAEDVFTLREGAIKLVRHLTDGSQRIVRVLKPGDLAGLEGLVATAYAHTAITLAPVVACRFPLGLIERLHAGQEGLQRRVLEKYQRALSETEAWLSELAAGSAPARVRVARLFLRLGLPQEAGDDGHRVLRVGPADIGDMLGVTVETASRVVAAMRREGVLGETGRNAPHYRADLAALRRIAEGER